MATEEEVLTIHSEEHLNFLKSTQNIDDLEVLEEKSSHFDAVYFHPKTYELSLYSSGSTIDLMSAIVSGEIKNGFALVRPPGHHAMASEPCGSVIVSHLSLFWLLMDCLSVSPHFIPYSYQIFLQIY